jgi:glycosyltransferase involved in cell wall biosynthesis
MWYRMLFSRNTALMHWCFIELPGQEDGPMKLRWRLKGFFRRFFDAFVVYSSVGKKALLRFGEPAAKVFVATNVGDTNHHLAASQSIPETRQEARAKLGLPERFTALYLGTLDEVKRPEIMLDLARRDSSAHYNFVLAGGGPLLESLQETVRAENLSNARLTGPVSDVLPLYCRAADVLIVPGRGGIVLSEAMAFGLPCIVHEADGTEVDLIKNRINGLRLTSGSSGAFWDALETLRLEPGTARDMGSAGLALVKEHYNVESMARQIIEAARYARASRRRHG